MVEIPDQMECLFSASVADTGDSYRIKVPQNELDAGAIATGETYRVVILEGSEPAESDDSQDGSPKNSTTSATPQPPVSKGDIREVTIETLGDQGDGIVKTERGYVVIVPGGRPDDELTIEIQQVRENVAFAQILAQEDEDESAL